MLLPRLKQEKRIFRCPGLRPSTIDGMERTSIKQRARSKEAATEIPRREAQAPLTVSIRKVNQLRINELRVRQVRLGVIHVNKRVILPEPIFTSVSHGLRERPFNQLPVLGIPPLERELVLRSEELCFHLIKDGCHEKKREQLTKGKSEKYSLASLEVEVPKPL